MQVFVTGATGYIGSAVVRVLLDAGHEVTGLVREGPKIDRLRAMGASVLVGNLHSPETFAARAAEHEAIVHAGFERGPTGSAVDQSALGALIEAARKSESVRCLAYTSGVMVLGDTGDRAVDESAPPRPAQIVAWRPAVERLALDGATDRLAISVIRPGMVYGGKGGHLARFFQSAESEGAAAYIGNGQNRWVMCHRTDVAQLYRLVAEKAARGVFHAVDGAAVPVEEIARACSEAAGKGGAVRGVPLDQARRQMGLFADAACLDQVIVAQRSADLGWTPRWLPVPASVPRAYEEWKAATGQTTGPI